MENLHPIVNQNFIASVATNKGYTASKNGLPQMTTEAYKFIGVNQKSWFSILRNEKQPTLETLYKLAHLWKVDVTQLAEITQDIPIYQYQA